VSLQHLGAESLEQPAQGAMIGLTLPHIEDTLTPRPIARSGTLN
jgi:hypothetical protein